MTDKFIDFDAFRAEQDLDPVKFRIGGVVYDLPPSLPASVAVDVIRMKQTMTDESMISTDKLAEFCSAVFGSELWAEVQDRHRITLSELPTLLTMVLAAYTESDEDPKAEAGQTSPTKESSSASSKRGRGSKRTS